MATFNPEDITCIFSGEFMEDPITTPQCGHTFSRQPLKDYRDARGDDFDCPICRTDLTEFDVDNAPKNIVIANIIDSMKEQGKEPPIIKVTEPILWSADLYHLKNVEDESTNVSCIEIKTNISLNQNKCLLIPIIDRSGSMSGNPMTQVNYSMKRVIDTTKQSSNLITNIIIYDDTYEILDIQKASQNPITARGGTNFRSAFKGLFEVLKKYKDDPFVCSAVIIFLTDGQDCSGDKTKLTPELKEGIETNWNKPSTVHTIGFGNNHEFQLLDSMRKAGQLEGAYRFADPNENIDSLSAKINSIFDTIASSINTEITIKLDTLIPLEYSMNEFKCNLSCDVEKKETISKYQLFVKRPALLDENLVVLFGHQEVHIPINPQHENDEETKTNILTLWSTWTNKLIDNIANEIIELSTNKLPDDLNKDIYYALLQQRIKTIQSQLTDETQEQRLTTLNDTFKQIVSGGEVNAKKLVDMKYEGNFKTKYDNNPTVVVQPPAITLPPKPITSSELDTYQLYHFRQQHKFQGGKSHSTLIHTKTHDINFANLENDTDNIGNTCLQLMATLGRYHTVKKILENLNYNHIDINHRNNYCETALDLAAAYGHSGTYALLKEYGAEHSINCDVLLYTCMVKSRGEYRTANELLKNKASVIKPRLMAKAPNKESFNWMMNKQADLMEPIDKLHIGLENGNFKSIQTVLTEHPNLVEKVDIMKCRHLFEKSLMDHIKIVQLLISKNLILANETFPADCTFNPTSDDDIDEITFPLFKAAGAGNHMMVATLVNYLTSEQINRTNNRGSTALWIASCNGHLDVVLNLLNAGASPNIVNKKGDGPLIPACQKGYTTIVESLLNSGAQIDQYNKNRDNPVLICCRTGQNQVLDVILKLIPNEVRELLLNDMTNAAEIDGFNPSLASAEVNKVECLKVLYKYGANLNIKTREDNNIIKGATPLHLACHYNRLATVKTLIQLGVNINAQTYDGSSALHIAVKGRYMDIVEFLLKSKIDKNIVDNEGNKADTYADKKLMEDFFMQPIMTPLINLIKCKDTNLINKCCQTIIKHTNSYGCYEYKDICEMDCRNGVIPLTIAIQYNNTKVIQILLYMGSDKTRADNNGLTPAFWLELIKPNMMTLYNVSNELSENDQLHLTKLIKTQSQSIQNKMLTNTEKLNYGMELVPIGSVIDKMNYGFMTSITEEMMENLELSQEIEHSLVGFLDKFKNTTMYFETKIKLIQLLSTTDTTLKPVHIIALYLWTYSPEVYKNVYDILGMQSNNNPIWEAYIYTLYSALTKLPNYEGEVYRAVETSFSPEKYPLKGQILWKSYGSTSTDWKHSSPFTADKKGIIFIIHSKTGKHLSKYSKHPADNEVVFLPNTRFLVENYYKANLCCLGQSNIRASSYSFSQTDIEKAINGKLSIVIELREI
jgi:ankyrin repeat protein/uncharacterized protein YegL